jgi:transcriptional regulator with XRE-family HTH domain
VKGFARKRRARQELVAIGRRIRRIRKARGLSGRDLARALGITQAHVSRMENGIQGLRSVTLLHLAEILRVSPFVFFIDEKQACRLSKALPPNEIRGIDLACPGTASPRRGSGR